MASQEDLMARKLGLSPLELINLEPLELLQFGDGLGVLEVWWFNDWKVESCFFVREC